MDEIPEFTREDYLSGTAPYEFLYKFYDDGFTLERMTALMSDNARALKVSNFKAIFGKYVEEQKRISNTLYFYNPTNFEGQEVELDAGKWCADETGVYTISEKFGKMYACVHPILPVLRLVNIDSGVEKLSLAYRKGKQWRHVIADKKTLASNNAILNLAEVGIAVNSENARQMVRYLHDIENQNYDVIPEKNSVSRLGWIDGEGFSPYVDDLVFDGDANFKTYFDAVSSHGDFERWLDTAIQARKGGIYARLILASSFASVLVKPLSGLPFFVHLWGGTEAGKTVGLMLSASVWANPEVGRYIHTFNSTAVGREKSAAFVNSLPLILDELQIVKDKKEFDKDIYMLSEGAGRTRGNKGGGVDRTPTWSNCILTSGEMPITSTASGSGAVNRIIEVECKEKLFDDPRSVADTVKKNYGFAGRYFVEMLQQDGNSEKATEIFKRFYAQLSGNDTTEKQALSAAIVLTADELATEWIFNDGMALSPEDISTFLQTKKEVSANERAYEYISQYVVSNFNKFCGESDDGEVWGKVEENIACIIKSQFDRICTDAKFNPRSVLSWLKQNGLISTTTKGFTRSKWINGLSTPCVCLMMPTGDEEEQKEGLIPDCVTGL